MVAVVVNWIPPGAWAGRSKLEILIFEIPPMPPICNCLLKEMVVCSPNACRVVRPLICRYAVLFFNRPMVNALKAVRLVMSKNWSMLIVVPLGETWMGGVVTLPIT